MSFRQEGPYFIPQGAPPGTPLLMEEERPPEAVYYFRIYAVLMILFLLVGFGFGLYLMLEPMLRGPSTLPGGSAVTGELIWGLFLMILSFVFMVPHAIALFAGRARWNYTLVTILLGLNLLWGWTSCCGMIVTIPLLIAWMKPETKRYFGVS